MDNCSHLKSSIKSKCMLLTFKIYIINLYWLLGNLATRWIFQEFGTKMLKHPGKPHLKERGYGYRLSIKEPCHYVRYADTKYSSLGAEYGYRPWIYNIMVVTVLRRHTYKMKRNMKLLSLGFKLSFQ